jgi:hypothetical protein
LTLFVGNNRLQLQQFGAEPEDTLVGTPGDGSLAALMLRPIGTLSMLGLMLHGAMGRLGEAAGVESFEFTPHGGEAQAGTRSEGGRGGLRRRGGADARADRHSRARQAPVPAPGHRRSGRRARATPRHEGGMSVLLQISDTHFGTEQPPVVEALLALAAQQRPDLVVLSGDITQRARPAQFRAAKAFVDRLGAPVLAVPGNHDIALFDLGRA